MPAGWRLWRGPVPAELGQFAVDTLASIGRYAYGSVAAQTSYDGAAVGAFKSHHTWTYRAGKLVTGLCIPGIALVVPTAAPIGVGSPAGLEAVAADLATPDTALAVYTAPPESTDWKLVAASGAALAATVVAFSLAMKLAARPRGGLGDDGCSNGTLDRPHVRRP